MSAEMEQLNIDQIARLAYVSRSVVSRVLNNHPNVSPETRNRVMRVIVEHGYTPSAAARSLAIKRTHEMGVIVPRRSDDVLGNAFWALLFVGISEAAARHDYLVSICMVSEAADALVRERIVGGRRFDGYILVNNEPAENVLPVLMSRKLPFVLLGRRSEPADLNWVDVDNTRGAAEAVEFLIGLGHRRIATITGSLEQRESTDRLAGFRQAMHEAGLTSDLHHDGHYTERGGCEGARALMSLPEPPTAIFCESDAMAYGALLAIYEMGRRVPDDVSVLGYDDLPSSAFTIPPLTTVRQPIVEMGECAVNALLSSIEDPRRAPIQQELQARLIRRASCAGPNR